jgi:formylglycine-generating enzyme required for sulfatase activity
VLRGGSYWDPQEDARCAVRLRDSPDARGDFGGFRIVVRPSSDSGL